MHLSLMGKVGELTSPHLVCENSTVIEGIYHKYYDLAILNSLCPTTALLNISQLADGRLGDEVVTFGFGTFGLVWHGMISGINIFECTDPNIPWRNSTHPPICADEFSVEGNQHEGMSGGPSANGCGYVGMFHAVNRGQKGGTYGMAISARTIVNFIRSNKHLLRSLSDCGNNMTVLSLPTHKFEQCSNPPSWHSESVVKIDGSNT